MSSTKEILDHHLQCFGKADLEGILSDYASDAILFTPQGPLQGRDAMKPVFVAMFAEFAKPGASFSITHQSISGDYAYMNWTGETADTVYDAISELVVIRNGKIAAHSFGGKMVPKRK